jgi:hypothetical protein
MFSLRTWIAVTLLIGLGSVPLAAQRCHPPYWRWTQKTETDLEPKRAETITVKKVKTTWDTLAWDKTAQYKCATRAGNELKDYTITAYVRRVRSEAATNSNPDGDGDWHIELTDTKGEPIAGCMVVEIAPAKSSPFFKQARLDLMSALGLSDLPKSGEYDPKDPVQVTFTGPAFFDGEHRKKAPNRTKGTQHGRCNETLWELHPVYHVAAAP